MYVCISVFETSHAYFPTKTPKILSLNIHNLCLTGKVTLSCQVLREVENCEVKYLVSNNYQVDRVTMAVVFIHVVYTITLYHVKSCLESHSYFIYLVSQFSASCKNSRTDCFNKYLEKGCLDKEIRKGCRRTCMICCM